MNGNDQQACREMPDYNYEGRKRLNGSDRRNCYFSFLLNLTVSM